MFVQDTWNKWIFSFCVQITVRISWDYIIFSKRYFTESLFCRTMTSLSNDVIWPNRHIFESSNKRKLIIPNVIFSNRRLAERFFSETSLNRMPFHRIHSAILYFLYNIIIAIYYLSSSAFVTEQMTESFLLLRLGSTRKSSVFSSLKHVVTGIDFNKTLYFWTRNYIQWKIFLMQLSLNIHVKLLNFSCVHPATV